MHDSKSLLHKLISAELVRDPKTGGKVGLSEDGNFVLSECSKWAIKNGVLDLYGNYESAAAVASADQEFVKAVCRSLNFPETTELLDAVSVAVEDTFLKSRDAEYSAEIAELADRLGIVHAHPIGQVIDDPHAQNYNQDARVTFERAFIEPGMTPGQIIRRSVRIRNDGRTPISSHCEAQPIFPTTGSTRPER